MAKFYSIVGICICNQTIAFIRISGYNTLLETQAKKCRIIVTEWRGGFHCSRGTVVVVVGGWKVVGACLTSFFIAVSRRSKRRLMPSESSSVSSNFAKFYRDMTIYLRFAILASPAWTGATSSHKVLGERKNTFMSQRSCDSLCFNVWFNTLSLPNMPNTQQVSLSTTPISTWSTVVAPYVLQPNPYRNLLFQQLPSLTLVRWLPHRTQLKRIPTENL